MSSTIERTVKGERSIPQGLGPIDSLKMNEDEFVIKVQSIEEHKEGSPTEAGENFGNDTSHELDLLQTPEKELPRHYDNISSLKQNIKIHINEELSQSSMVSRRSERRKQTMATTLRGRKIIGESFFGAEHYKTEQEERMAQEQEIGPANFIAH